jgi:hypothetical protein
MTYQIKQHQLILEDGLNGIYDYEHEHTITDMYFTGKMSYMNNKIGWSKDRIYTAHFVLSEQNTKYQRIAYTFMEVLGDIGGLIEIVFLVAHWLLLPANYNITGIQMLKKYIEHGQHQNMKDLKLSLKSFSYDLCGKYRFLKKYQDKEFKDLQVKII